MYAIEKNTMKDVVVQSWDSEQGGGWGEVRLEIYSYSQYLQKAI
jgi:hypothetical protein